MMNVTKTHLNKVNDIKKDVEEQIRAVNDLVFDTAVPKKCALSRLSELIKGKESIIKKVPT